MQEKKALERPIPLPVRENFRWVMEGEGGQLAEAMLFAYANEFAPGYSGGLWLTYRCPRAGTRTPYMPEPRGPEAPLQRICFPDNGSNVVTDPASAGAALWLMVLNHVGHRFHERGKKDLADRFFKLYEGTLDAVYADSALDHTAIYQFLD